MSNNGTPNRIRILVGVDGSDASIEALRQAQKLAPALGSDVDATGYWDYPQMYAGYVAMGIEGFEERAGRHTRTALSWWCMLLKWRARALPCKYTP